MTRAVIALRLLILMLAFGLVPYSTAAASTIKVVYSFCHSKKQCSDGAMPSGDLLADSFGDLFGVLSFGGQNGGGTIFELIPNADHSQWTYRTLYSFCAQTECADGAHPRGQLIIDNAGNLYGGTTSGGAGRGVIFKLSPNGTYTILYALCPEGDPCSDGVEPTSLTYAGASAGSTYDGVSPLYGETCCTEPSAGNVFSLENNGDGTWTYSVIHVFCSVNKCADGKSPWALVSDANGTLFGVTQQGGKSKRGVLFKLVQNGNRQWDETPLHYFCSTEPCTDGARPVSIKIASDGTLYGTTASSGPNCHLQRIKHECGSIFSINADGTNYSLLYGFCDWKKKHQCVDGRVPVEMNESQSNNYFGATAYGGPSDSGTLFQYQNGSFESLYTFSDGLDGKWPSTGLTADGSGSLFGATSSGGEHKHGAVFELTP